MFNFLEGFEKRMEMVGVVESIVNRKRRNMELEKLFNDNDFINLVFSVLIYIMEKTLSEDSDCTIENISKFIEDILPKYYDIHLDKIMLNDLTNYIIKNVLQNEGTVYHFKAVDYYNNSRKNIRIKLISDYEKIVNGNGKINYSLTDQGYDFLFRTKEVDQEIKMTIEELKLKELIKRKNFKKAYDQSLNLIQMVRQKKKEIQIFMMKIKENIYDVDIEEYEKLINSTYNLLNDEYNLLNEIMKMSRKSEEKLKQEYEVSQKLDESLKKAQRELKRINENIKVTLSEQKDLILSRQSLSKVYLDTISDSFVYSLENRFDIDETILKQMERHIDKLEKFWMLVNPLFMPNIHKNLNIRSIYEPQGMIKLIEEEKVKYLENEDLKEDIEKERVERINQIYIEILDYILKFALNNNGKCKLEEVINSLKNDKEYFNRLVEDRLLFTTLLKLYDIGIVDIDKWRNSDNKTIMNITEEFNLEYTLHILLDKYEYIKDINKFYLLKEDDDLIEVEINRSVKEDLKVIEKISISNFTIKVERENE